MGGGAAVVATVETGAAMVVAPRLSSASSVTAGATAREAPGITMTPPRRSDEYADRPFAAASALGLRPSAMAIDQRLSPGWIVWATPAWADEANAPQASAAVSRATKKRRKLDLPCPTGQQ